MNQPIYCSSNPPLPLEPSSSNDAVFSYWKWRDQTDADVDDGGTGAPVTSWRACTDCGNRAKKECKFRRCRTCCRARAFPCSTHVRSTWVPVASRRQRQAVAITGTAFDGYSGSSSASKRSRFNDSQTTATATSYSYNSISNNALATFTFTPQDAMLKQSLPSKVHAPAIFRCHRVTAISDGEVEVAYQVAVRICGHVFKGFLYDQGVDEKNGDYSSSSSPIVVPSTPNPSSPS